MTAPLLQSEPRPGRAPERVDQTRSACQLREEIALGQTAFGESLSQLQQSVAVLADGRFATVWEEGVYPARRVLMQWIRANGAFVFPPGGKALTDRNVDHYNPVLVPDAGSGAYVAFLRASEIIVQKFDGAGNPEWPGDGVVAIDGIDGFFFALEPSLVENPAGGVFVCEQIAAAGNWDIRCQSLDRHGARQWSGTGESAANGGAVDLRVLPRGVADGVGGFLVFWRNQRDPFSQSSEPELMEGQHFAADGSLLWGATPRVVRTTNLPPDNGYSYRFFQVVTDGNGGAVLAFNDSATTSSPNLLVMAQRVSGGGALLWGSGVTVASGPGSRQHDQTIATRDGGAFVVSFDNISSTHNRLSLFRLGADGSQLWSPDGVLISDPDSSALDFGAFGVYDGQSLRLAWTHQRSPATYDFDAAFAAYRADGMLTSQFDLTSAPGGQFVNGVGYSESTGEFLAVWDDWRNGPPPADTNTGGTILKTGSCGSGLFHTVAPCRLVDTRISGSPLPSSVESDFHAVDSCGVPSSATDLVMNVTVVGGAAAGHLVLFPAGQFRPATSALNFKAGQTRANNSILHLSLDGTFAIYPFLADGSAQHVVVDVAGYFE